MRLLISCGYNDGILTRELTDKELAAFANALDGAGRVKWDWNSKKQNYHEDAELEIKFMNSGSPLCPDLSLRDHTREVLAQHNKGESP